MKRLDELGLRVTTVDHPAVFTVAESAAVERGIPGGHTKNLFLTNAQGNLWLVVAHAHTRVDLKRLARALGSSRLSFGKPELLKQTLDVTPGSVTVFALMAETSRRLDVIIDEALMAFDSLNGHPMENTATTNIARDDLFRFIRACGHEPRILYLAQDTPGASG